MIKDIKDLFDGEWDNIKSSDRLKYLNEGIEWLQEEVKKLAINENKYTNNHFTAFTEGFKESEPYIYNILKNNISPLSHGPLEFELQAYGGIGQDIRSFTVLLKEKAIKVYGSEYIINIHPQHQEGFVHELPLSIITECVPEQRNSTKGRKLIPHTRKGCLVTRKKTGRSYYRRECKINEQR